MSLRPLDCWPLIAVTAWAAPSLALVDRASAESYFCSPAPIKLGSYRPSDADGELDIKIRFPNLSPFWFDNQSGDYVAYTDGVVGQTEPSRLPVPLDAAPRTDDSLGFLVNGIFQAGQCVPSPVGVVPPAEGSTR